MEIVIRACEEKELPRLTALWNAVVEEGTSFPQDRPFSADEAGAFFAAQTFTAAAVRGTELLGFYILHPNNAGHCAHIANASYGVAPAARGLGIGERLVRHSLDQCRERGFLGLQFNAVVATNFQAIRLYEKLGFERIGVSKNGYRFKDGSYADLVLFNKQLV